ncbi:MAG: cytochrome b/b6 domain-containing protein [Bryobacteraceae bacterium]|nr:cytochrome b/b6 domain-containing protein [Bryobacteraceae bacterium]
MSTWGMGISHWLAAVAVVILTLSGIQIFQAFPGFAGTTGVIDVPLKGLGGWLGGALAWHFAFAWIYSAAGLLYAADLLRGGWRRLAFGQNEWRGIWPMLRYYFLRGPQPVLANGYNPLQKAAYLAVLTLGATSLLTGLLLAQPVQIPWVMASPASWPVVRLLHFVAMLGFVSFVPGHILMVLISRPWSFRTIP